MPHKPPAPCEPADYRAWKARAAAMLERAGHFAGHDAGTRPLAIVHQGATHGSHRNISFDENQHSSELMLRAWKLQSRLILPAARSSPQRQTRAKGV
jgi:hypothetical protein